MLIRDVNFLFDVRYGSSRVLWTNALCCKTLTDVFTATLQPLQESISNYNTLSAWNKSLFILKTTQHTKFSCPSDSRQSDGVAFLKDKLHVKFVLVNLSF